MQKMLKYTACLSALIIIAACTKLCSSGYEGSNCNTLSKTKFIGVWTVGMPPTTIAYLDTISDTTGAPNVVISHSFAAYAFAHSITATVNSNIITIPNQQPDNDSIFVNGSGTINSADSSINWIYTISNKTDTTTTTSVWSK